MEIEARQAFNEESTIGSLLNRLEDSGADELLVADGGSMDGTAEIASRHARIVQTSTGRAVQMNAAAQCAIRAARDLFSAGLERIISKRAALSRGSGF